MTGLKLQVRAPSEGVQGEWDTLAARVQVPPFMRAGWLVSWARAFAPGPLRLLCASRDGELVGVLPFLQQRWTRCSPTNWHSPMFGWVAADEEASFALAHALLVGARARADFSFLRQRDPGLQILERAATDLGQSMIVRTAQRSPYVDLQSTDWTTYLDSLPRKTRKEAKRLRRRLDEQGLVTVEFAQNVDSLDAMLAEGFELEQSGWKAQRGTAIASDPATERFYTDVARWANARGELLLAFLRLDGRPVAFDFCLQSGDAMYVLKGGFDPEFRRFGPGMLLTYESLRRGFELGLRSYELLGADDAYKLVWASEVRELVRFQSFTRSPGGAVSRLAWSHGRATVKRARDLVDRGRTAARSER